MNTEQIAVIFFFLIVNQTKQKFNTIIKLMIYDWYIKKKLIDILIVWWILAMKKKRNLINKTVTFWCLFKNAHFAINTPTRKQTNKCCSICVCDIQFIICLPIFFIYICNKKKLMIFNYKRQIDFGSEKKNSEKQKKNSNKPPTNTQTYTQDDNLDIFF